MIVLRRAGSADWMPAAHINVRAWQHTYQGVMSDEFLGSMVPEEWSAWRQVRYRDPHPDMTNLILSNGGRVVGYCDVGRSRSDERGDITGVVYAIYVDPDHLGKGMGKRLMIAGRAALRRLGHRRAELWVLDSNERARRFYAADGWKTDGSTKVEHMGGAEITEVRYVCDL